MLVCDLLGSTDLYASGAVSLVTESSGAVPCHPQGCGYDVALVEDLNINYFQLQDI